MYFDVYRKGEVAPRRVELPWQGCILSDEGHVILDCDVVRVEVVGAPQELPPRWGASKSKTIELHPLADPAIHPHSPRVLLEVADNTPEPAPVGAKPKRKAKVHTPPEEAA